MLDRSISFLWDSNPDFVLDEIINGVCDNVKTIFSTHICDHVEPLLIKTNKTTNWNLKVKYMRVFQEGQKVFVFDHSKFDCFK
jgi:hypothetical protein